MSSPQPNNTLAPGPMLPVVGLVLSVVGLCLPPLLLISFGIGLYSFLRAKKDPAWAVRTQIAQMTMAVSAAGTLVLLGILVPGLKRRQAYMQQVECQNDLNALYAAQSRLYAKEKRYTTKLSELDWQPVKGRHLIRLAADGALEEVGLPIDEAQNPQLSNAKIDAAVPQLLRREVGIKGECPACSITMLCATDLDGDPTVDVWTVSSVERTSAAGSKIAGGIAWCESDDSAM